MRNSTSPGDHPVLSRTADHALRALLVLARRENGEPMPAEAIAELTGAPATYLGKTLNALAKAGLLRSMRGPTGGFALAVPADAITVARIADLFSEPPAHPRCLLGTGPCNASAPCGAHRRWKRLSAAARAPLIATTIADLLSDVETVRPSTITDRPPALAAAGTL